MKEANNLKWLLIGTAAFFLFFFLWVVLAEGSIKAGGVSVFAGSAILFTLVLQVYTLQKSKGLQQKFVLLLLLGTLSYGAGEVIWFYEEKVRESLMSVPFWSDLLYIINLLLYISAFALLTLAVKNRYQVVYFAIDILIVYFSLIAILWVYWLHPLYNEAGVAYGNGVTSFVYPALELLLLFALSATMFLKKYFFPARAMLLFVISFAILFTADSGYVLVLYYNAFEPNSILEALWSSAVILQGIAALELLRSNVSFKAGENEFSYEAGSNPAARTVISIFSILILYAIFTISGDVAAGGSLLLIIFLAYSRQLMTSSQLSHMTASYQNLARNLEEQVNKRTEELRKKNTELEKSTARLKYIALHDQLTEIWNRRALEGRLRTLFEKSLEEEVEFALIFIDIDKFKEINDQYGHSYGDELLIQFTERVRKEFPSDAFIARQSGDEFVVIIEDGHSKEEIETTIQRFFFANEKGYRVFGEEIRITFSLGASFFPEDSRNVNELLQAADMAMYAVKQQGRNSYQFY
ncbi:diguanylate cyclase domain-containing protein [Bacillus sp. AK031]